MIAECVLRTPCARESMIEGVHAKREKNVESIKKAAERSAASLI
jgi:hypothetical protein